MTQTKRSCALTCVVTLLAAATMARAAISVGPDGSGGGSSGVLAFDSQPAAADFATYVLTGGGATYLDPAGMDAGAQTLDASVIVNQLSAVAQATPGTFAGGMRWNSQTLYLQSRPTTSSTNAAGVMKAVLENNSGGDLTEVTIAYDFGLYNDVDEEVPGFRVFWSLTGAPASWTLLSVLSGNETVGRHSESMGTVVWPAGSTLYLLWADDNDDGLSDQGMSIDNFEVRGISTTVTCVDIVGDPMNLTVPERGAASFSIMATGSPQTITWYRSDDGGTTYNEIAGANGLTYSIASVAFPGDNGAKFFATVSNSLCMDTSAVATLTVQQDLTAPFPISVIGDLDPTVVRVTFSEAMDANFVNEGNFTVYAVGADPDNPADPNVLLSTSALLAPDGTNVTVTTSSGRILGTNYLIRMLDQHDASSGNNPTDPNPTITNIQPNVLLIGFDVENEWKWTAETNLFGTGWETVSYDDSDPVMWPAGPAALGVNTDANPNPVPIRTTTAYAANSAPQFFRRHFLLPSGTNGLSLQMRYFLEDGGVVFINGQEAGRFNVGPGPLSVTTRATANYPENTPLPAPVSVPTTNVVAGDNVIAVVVIQNGGTSSDSIMALELIATITEFASGPPSILAHPQSQSVDEGALVTFSVLADGAVPLTYHWLKDGSPIPGANSSSYTIVGVVPSQAGDYSVIVSNSVGTSNSAVATLTVAADVEAPVFVSALASTNLTNIVLTLTDNFGMNAETVTNPANWAVSLVAGGGDLVIESVVMTSPSTFVMTTSPRTQGQDYQITASEVVDRAEAQNPLTPSSRRVVSQIVVLTPDDTTLWRFDTASNNLDGTTWFAPGFDDSSWLTGVAGFTTSNALETTDPGFELRTTNMIAPASGGPVTAYYRVPFNFPGAVSNATVHLVGVIDDGLVAYINGVEAGRVRVTNDSPVSFTNLASAASPEASNFHTTESIALTNLSALVPGMNLLAIQLHQNDPGSSDAVLSVQVVAGTQEFAQAGPEVNVSYNSGTGQVTITWSGSGVLQETADLQSSGTVWTDVAGNPTSPYTFTPTGEKKFYRLRP